MLFRSDEQVLMALGRYLGKMGDAQHLSITAQAAKQATNHFGGAATNAYIHLVKDQCWCGGSLRNHHLNGQADA